MKNHIDCTEIFQKVAAAHHTTVEEVRREIALAIEGGMADPDPDVQAKWAELTAAGEKPTPDEFIAFLARRIQNES